MARKPVLVVMAAGMGSRYGGLKQMDAVGGHGEAILDYSLYDAYRAGFETAVIIIKKEIRQEFMQIVGARLESAPWKSDMLTRNWIRSRRDFLCRRVAASPGVLATRCGAPKMPLMAHRLR